MASPSADPTNTTDCDGESCTECGTSDKLSCQEPAGQTEEVCGIGPRAVTGDSSGCGSSSTTTCEASVSLSPGSGNVQVELQVPGLTGPGVNQALRVVYNSVDGGVTTVLGKGWNSNFLSSLSEDVLGNVTIRDGDGFEAHYTKSGSVYSPGRGLRRDLVKDVDDSFIETLRFKDDWGRRYDTTGKLLSWQTGGGVAHQFEYSDDKLSRVWMASGQTTYFFYTGARLTAIGDYARRGTYFTYDASNNLTRLDAPGCCTQLFGYDSNGRMRTRLDSEGFATYYEYEMDRVERISRGGFTTYFAYTGDTLTSVTDGRGKEWNYIHDANDVLDQAQTPLGNATKKGFGSRLEKLRTQDPLGNTTYFEYDAKLNRNAVIDPRWNRTYYGYDTSNNHVLTVDPLLQSTYMEYDGARRLTKHIDARDNATQYTYDAVTGNRLSTTDALSNATLYGYDSLGRLVRQRDRRLNATYFGYDTAGNRTARMNAVKDTAYFAYNPAGELIWEKDELGRSTYFTYDTRGLEISRQDPLGVVWTKGYDAFGQLTSQTDALSRTDQFTYDGEGNRTRQARQVGAGYVFTYFEYDAGNRQIGMTDSRWTQTYYAYDAADRMVKTVADAAPGGLSLTTYFEYDEAGNQTKVIDPNGNATQTAYDPLNRASVVTDALGQVTSSGYDPVSNLLRSVDAQGNTTYFNYDALNRQSSVADRLWQTAPGSGFRHTTYFEYDAEGNQTKVVDANSNATLTGYDALNRRAATRDPMGFATYFRYDKVGNVTAQADARGFATYFFYDDRNRRSVIQGAENNPTYYTYDPVGNLTVLKNSRYISTFYTYDQLNRLMKTQDAFASTYFGYDQASNQTRVLNRRGFATYFGYDAVNRRDRVLDAGGFITYFSYDANGNQTALRDPRLNTTSFDFDALNRLTRSHDSIGVISDTAYDPNGNVTQSSRGAGVQSVYFAYDAQDRMVTVQDGQLGITYFEYDGAGNRVQVIDANTRATLLGYDARNLLAKVQAPDGGAVYFDYDGNGNTTEQTDPRDNITSFAYDKINRLTSVIDPLAKAISFQYDANSNLTRMTSAEASTAKMFYDSLDRLASVTYTPAGRDVAIGISSAYFTYDPEGNTTAMADLWGNHVMAYDRRNLPTKHRFPDNNTVYFEYDGNANMTALIYPGAAGRALSDYDARNRQSEVQSPSGQMATFTYTSADQPAMRELGNGVRQHASYDAAGRTVNWLNADLAEAPLTYFQYTRDPKGLPTRCVREDPHTIYYTYDPNDRLAKEQWVLTAGAAQVYAFSYDYDTAGNRVKMKVQGTSFAGDTYYAYNTANALTLKGTDIGYANPSYYYYDDNGSLIALHDTSGRAPGGAGVTYFRYNPAMLIDRVEWKDGSRTQFFYDGNLQRYALQQTPSGGPASTAYFLWNGPNILQERAPGNVLTAEHTHAQTPIAGIGQLVETYRPQEPVPGDRLIYPVMDMRGTIHKWVKADGTTVLASREYDAFGRVIVSAGTWPSRFSYQGQAWIDLCSANLSQRLLLSPARVYLPDDGVFASRDPVEWYLQTVITPHLANNSRARPRQSNNAITDRYSLHNYNHSNPLITVDPTGLQNIPAIQCTGNSKSVPVEGTFVVNLKFHIPVAKEPNEGDKLKLITEVKSFYESPLFRAWLAALKKCCCICVIVDDSLDFFVLEGGDSFAGSEADAINMLTKYQELWDSGRECTFHQILFKSFSYKLPGERGATAAGLGKIAGSMGGGISIAGRENKPTGRQFVQSVHEFVHSLGTKHIEDEGIKNLKVPTKDLMHEGQLSGTATNAIHQRTCELARWSLFWRSCERRDDGAKCP